MLQPETNFPEAKMFMNNVPHNTMTIKLFLQMLHTHMSVWTICLINEWNQVS